MVRKEIRNSPSFIRLNLRREDLEVARRPCYYKRRSVFPSLPMNIMEVHEALEKIDTSCLDGDEFLLVNDVTNNLIIFSTTKNLTYLCQLQTIFMDGTFLYCTKFFHQSFTIHGINNDNY